MHPRNLHREGYDFAALVAASPELGRVVRPAPHGGPSIDFADPAAVRALNRALLKKDYGVREWDIPEGYLCPPVPGRADYVHALADLLAEENGGVVPRGAEVRVLDVGVGANCIYPLIGRSVYGWRFVGSEVDGVAWRNALEILRRNEIGVAEVNVRRQPAADAILRGVIRPGETFAATMCNPPFHASAEEAASGTRRKLRNLAGDHRAPSETTRNFGGQTGELWCAGGELGFVRRMIAESLAFAEQVGWFTTLVSKSAHVGLVREALRRADAAEVRTIAMAQGQKQSRIVAWRFLKVAPARTSRR